MLFSHTKVLYISDKVGLYSWSMNGLTGLFNNFFHFAWILTLCGISSLLLQGCATTSSSDDSELSKEEKKALKEEEKANRDKYSLVKFFLETPQGSNNKVQEVEVYRAYPEKIYIGTREFLDERDFEEVNIIDTPDGGFMIEFILTAEGSGILQNITGRYRGRRMVIFANFGDPRYLGAPKIDRLITDGNIRITPDASREEAERFALGMKNTIRQIKRKAQWL